MLFRVFLILISINFTLSDRFEEELLIKDLGNGFSGLHFNFLTRKPVVDDFHFHIFPKSLYTVISKYNVEEFHLSMSQGFWDRSKWSVPFNPIVSGGAEIWAWFSPQTLNVEKHWAYFLEALSGQFCASLAHLGLPQNHISPQLSFRPSGLSQELTFSNDSYVFRYAQLPHEEVCTENLTPWSKLLPCKKLGGLASMFKPMSVFKSTYSALSIDLRRVCSDLSCLQQELELRQTLTFVFNRRHLYNSVNEPWSLTGLLGDKMNRSCMVADRSEIVVLRSETQMNLKPSPKPASMTNWDDERVFAVYSPSHDFANDILITSFPLVEKSRFSMATGGGVSIMKYVTGKGDIDGGVTIELCNHLSSPLPAVLLDSAPWYTEVYFSSLAITHHPNDNAVPSSLKPDKVKFQPSVPRKRMSQLELLLRLPAAGCVRVSYSFKKVLMHWNEYSPDANHGIYLPAASLIYQLASLQLRGPASPELALPMWASTYAEYLSAGNRSGSCRRGAGFVRLYSETALVRLPVPDFSMPFNALCLVCSVVALLFGGLHKLTTTPLLPAVAQGDEEVVDRPPLARLLARLRDALARLKTKLRKPHTKAE